MLHKAESETPQDRDKSYKRARLSNPGHRVNYCSISRSLDCYDSHGETTTAAIKLTKDGQESLKRQLESISHGHSCTHETSNDTRIDIGHSYETAEHTRFKALVPPGVNPFNTQDDITSQSCYRTENTYSKGAEHVSSSDQICFGMVS